MTVTRCVAFSWGVHLFCPTIALNWQWNMVQEMNSLNLGNFTLSAPDAVFPKHLCPACTSIPKHAESRLCHLTSTSTFTNCMSSHIPQLSMLNSSWSFLFTVLPTEFLVEAPSPLVNRSQDCLRSLVDLPLNSDHMQSIAAFISFWPAIIVALTSCWLGLHGGLQSFLPGVYGDLQLF